MDVRAEVTPAGVPGPSLGRSTSCATPPEVLTEPRPLKVTKWGRQRAAAMMPFAGRVKSCHLAFLGPMVEGWRSPSRKTGSWRKLMKCGSIYECAICSAQVSTHRAAEVLRCIDGMEAVGGGVALVTLTFPHTREDDLAGLRDRLTLAWRYFTMGAPYGRLRASLGIKRSTVDGSGIIVARELTYGDAAGWHPHLHVLVFTRKGAEAVVAARARFYRLWVKACVRAGLPRPSRERGVDIRAGNRDAAGYVSKWGLDSEIALHGHKRAKGDRYSPFQLLDQADYTGSVRYVHLWKTYLDAIKGQRQLTWSRGLKAFWGVEEIDDQAVAQLGGEDDEFKWVGVPIPLWRKAWKSGIAPSLSKALADGNVRAFHDALVPLLRLDQFAAHGPIYLQGDAGILESGFTSDDVE